MSLVYFVKRLRQKCIVSIFWVITLLTFYQIQFRIHSQDNRTVFDKQDHLLYEWKGQMSVVITLLVWGHCPLYFQFVQLFWFLVNHELFLPQSHLLCKATFILSATPTHKSSLTWMGVAVDYWVCKKTALATRLSLPARRIVMQHYYASAPQHNVHRWHALPLKHGLLLCSTSISYVHIVMSQLSNY